MRYLVRGRVKKRNPYSKGSRKGRTKGLCPFLSEMGSWNAGCVSKIRGQFELNHAEKGKFQKGRISLWRFSRRLMTKNFSAEPHRPRGSQGRACVIPLQCRTSCPRRTFRTVLDAMHHVFDAYQNMLHPADGLQSIATPFFFWSHYHVVVLDTADRMSW